MYDPSENDETDADTETPEVTLHGIDQEAFSACETNARVVM